MNAINDFCKKEAVKTEAFDDLKNKNGNITVDVPAKSEVLITLDQ